MKLKAIAKKSMAILTALALFISPLSDYLPILGEGMKVSAENYEYAMFPMETLSISQGEGVGSHYYSYALDLVGSIDVHAPFTGKIVEIDYNSYGAGHRVVLESLNEVLFADGTKDIMTIKLNHDNDISNLKIGQIINQGEVFYQAGDYGNASGVHVHIECARGKYAGHDYLGPEKYAVLKNKIHVYNALWLSSSTKIVKDGGYNWKKYDVPLDLTTTPLNLGDQFLAAIQSSDGTKALTVDSNNNVSIQKYVGTPNQTWMFTRTDGNYYEIKNPATGKCLDAANGGNVNDTNIQVWTDNDTSSQRYGIYGSQGGYALKVKYSTTHVVDYGGGNNNVHLWKYDPIIAAQKFRIFCLFDNVSVKNITSTNALVAAKFHKPSEAKALSYDISVSTSSSMQNAVTLSCKPSSTNVGSTSRDITFDFVKEYNHYLSANTTYYYRLIGKYDINGSTVTYTSPVYSFKTLADSADPSVTVKTSTSHYKNNITNTNAIIYGEVDKPTSYPVTKIGIRVRVDGGTYENGWSRYDGTSSTYVGSTFMCPYYDMNKELKLTLTHSTKYFYKFYAVVNGKEYWSPEGSFTTTGNHSFGPWVTTKPATCTESGVQTRSCSCGKTETQTIPATGHSYGAWTTTKAPTCTDSGIQTRSCTKCGDMQTQTIAAKGHSYSSEWTVDVQPTCTADGSKSHHCTVCGAKTDITSVPALGHNYVTTIVPPTVDSDGYTLHQCTRCSHSYKDNYVPKILLGDVNHDGKINTTDARWVLQAISGSRTLTDEERAAADVNKDGKINTADAKWILQAVSGSRYLG